MKGENMRKEYKPLHMKNFNQVNEPYECVMLLEKINRIITTLYELSDTRYYLDYIFNQSIIIQEQLREKGFNEDYFSELAYKFEELRSIAYGECIDWQGLVEYELRLIAASERETNKQNEDYIRKLEYKIKQLEKESHKDKEE